MITSEDIERFRQMEKDAPKKLVVIEIQQFFKIEIPADVDPKEFVDTDECRQICADKILDQTVDLVVESVGTEKDKNGIWNIWSLFTLL